MKRIELNLTMLFLVKKEFAASKLFFRCFWRGELHLFDSLLKGSVPTSVMWGSQMHQEDTNSS